MQADKPSNGLSSAVQTMSRLVQTISGGPEPYKRQHQYEQVKTYSYIAILVSRSQLHMSPAVSDISDL